MNKRHTHCRVNICILIHVLNEDIIFEYFRESSRVLKKGGIAFMHVSTKKPKVVKFNMMKIFGFWDFIKMTMNNSPIYRPFHWRINKMIKKIKKYFISIKTNKINKLEKEFQKIDSWKGCYVNSDNLMNLLSELNFKPIRIINIGTKYTYYIVKKSA